MKRLILIICLPFFYSSAVAQLNLKNEDVLDDKALKKKVRLYDTTFGLSALIDSKNIIEIRLYQYEFGSRCRTLCYDGNKWSGQSVGTIIFADEAMKTLDLSLDFNKVLDKLVASKIFSLPDQKKLTLKGTVEMATNYSIAYKVADKFRSYDFSSPKEFLKMNKDVLELKDYLTIMNVFDSIYKKRKAP